MDLDASAVWDFAGEIVGTITQRKGKTLATVTRIDNDGTAWVTTDGEGEAPASTSAVGVQVGDTVALEWDGATMGISSNVSSPAPSGGTFAAVTKRVQSVASAAQKIADAVNQHFFADTHGIHVTSTTQEEWDAQHVGPNVLINSLGQLFRDGLNNLLTLTTENGARALTIWDGAGNAAANIRAIIGETISLGRTGESHTVIDYHSMQLVDKDDVTYMDVRDESTSYDGRVSMRVTVDLSEYTDGKSLAQVALQDAPQIEMAMVYVDTALTRPSYTLEGNTVTFDPPLTSSDGGVLYVNYWMLFGIDKAYTLGIRTPESTSGEMSFASGFNTTASGQFSHAEGSGSTASGGVSHAEGRGSVASGAYSHAEGDQTEASYNDAHAEGRGSVASGAYSHAEGSDTIASGDSSHAQNEGTIAATRAQTVIGRYNVADTSSGIYGDYALIIGNGDQYTRSNALTVDWDGNIVAGGVAVPTIQRGVVAQGTTVPAGGHADVSVSFNHIYTSAPTVVAGLLSTSAAGAIGSISVAVRSVTTAGFTARLFNAGTSDRAPGFYWIALG